MVEIRWPPTWTVLTREQPPPPTYSFIDLLTGLRVTVEEELAPIRSSAYRATRGGNLEVAVDLSRTIAGMRAYVERIGYPERTEPGEMEGTLPEELAKLVVPPRPPTVAPTLEPARVDFGTGLIPRAAVNAYREYVRRLPIPDRTIPWYVFGGAWALYTAQIEAAPFGYFTQMASRGELIYGPVQQRALRPAQVAELVGTVEIRGRRVPVIERPGTFTEADEVIATGGRQVPVIYYTLSALLRYVGTPGQLVSLRWGAFAPPDFNHVMRGNGWTSCGRLERAQNAIWCPGALPTERRELAEVPLQTHVPTAERLGEAPPPRAGQRVLEEIPEFQEKAPERARQVQADVRRFQQQTLT